MELPASLFVRPEVGSNPYKALQKALREKPRVRLIGELDDEQFFLVEKTTALGIKRIVRLRKDRDGEWVKIKNKKHPRLGKWQQQDGEYFLSCSCPAGNPPIDIKTRLPEFVPMACYHVGAVLIQLCEKFGELGEAG